MKKRVLYLLITIVLMLNMVACTSETTSSTKMETTTEQTTERITEQETTTKQQTTTQATTIQETTTIQTTTAVVPTETIVHITKTGEKYHRSGCRYLSKSDISVDLSDAKAQGYTPCSVCNPPQ